MSENKMIPQKPVLEVLCAIQGALGEENQKVFAKASMTLGKPWGKTVPVAENPAALMNQIAKYLRDDLKLAQSITVEKQGQEYIVKNRGCYICHGKMVKETYGIKTRLCYVYVSCRSAFRKPQNQKRRLKEIRKPGPTGDCDGSTKSQTDPQPLYFWNDADPKGL